MSITKLELFQCFHVCSCQGDFADCTGKHLTRPPRVDGSALTSTNTGMDTTNTGNNAGENLFTKTKLKEDKNMEGEKLVDSWEAEGGGIFEYDRILPSKTHKFQIHSYFSAGL